MCGIAAILDRSSRTFSESEGYGKVLVSMLEKIAYRGDKERFGETFVSDRFALGTNRLAIVGRDDGQQPLVENGGGLLAIFNGEIYNFRQLRAELERAGFVFRTSTDTEVLIYGYRAWKERLPEKIDGMFAFVVYDSETGEFLAARDHIGIKPLYYTVVSDVYYFASEQKCLVPFSDDITTVSPGCLIKNGQVRRYHDFDETPLEMSQEEIVERVRMLFKEAVKKRVDTDLPIGVTFSGGLDSTAVLHFAHQYHPNVTAFTIGFKGAVDVEVASRYCKDYGIPHKIYELDQDELTNILPRIVYEAEFFEGVDVMDTCLGYFPYQEIRKHGIKVALCGEGSDEVLAGYDLFRSHKDRDELMRYRVKNLHRTDVQRVDRSSMMNSVEARVPFLDKAFLEFAYQIPMALKLVDGVEKWIFREAFRGDLPDYIIERTKVRMPDGSGLKNTLYDYAAQQAAKQSGPLPERMPNGLELRTPQDRFFLEQYLNAGFPLPKERFRLPGYDFSDHGYFDFVS